MNGGPYYRLRPGGQDKFHLFQPKIDRRGLHFVVTRCPYLVMCGGYCTQDVHWVIYAPFDQRIGKVISRAMSIRNNIGLSIGRHISVVVLILVKYNHTGPPTMA